MHGPFDKTPKEEPNIYRNWSMMPFALPLLLAIALIGYVVSHPDVVKCVADGARAEFAGAATGRDGKPPKPVAQPPNQARTIPAR